PTYQGAAEGCGWPSISEPLELEPFSRTSSFRCGWPSISEPLEPQFRVYILTMCCGWPSISEPLELLWDKSLKRRLIPEF
ncbi:MAG: hypothetical protein AAF830_17685, partial [Pseudomonadota bacterium]